MVLSLVPCDTVAPVLALSVCPPEMPLDTLIPLIQLDPLPTEWLVEVESVTPWLSLCAHEVPTLCVSDPPFVQASLVPTAWLSPCACPQPCETPSAVLCATACVPLCPPESACPSAAMSGMPSEKPMFTLPRRRLAKLLATRATSTSVWERRLRSMCSAVT